uniref:Uncharacterized protein n=1 Tax=Salix viminalis TaxID=40686 RepID=A0A6N2LR52_SALVM
MHDIVSASRQQMLQFYKLLKDLSLTHCMQIQTLIDASSNRFEMGSLPLIKQIRVQRLVYAESGEALVITVI